MLKNDGLGKEWVKKKVTISADDNIIPDPDIALEILTESVPKPAKKKTGSRSTISIVIQDTPSPPKLKPDTSKLKLKGIPSLTLEEQLAADIMQALKESKKPNIRQPGTGGSSEGIEPKVKDKQEVKKADDQEIENIQDEEGKNFKDQ
ncbi:hypothetical protein Tco_0990822 [Tanacetum coccineum]|uniref:Uncharacterized protein n=1 Tax=Tanacetum coccineum TaxID=301880 RepID=A0ABQ5EXK7_9ASTR